MTVARKIQRRANVAIGDWPDGITPLLRRVYAARGAHDVASAHPRLAGLLSPDGLLGMDSATALLGSAIADGRHILVVGDFDCDGATACAVGVRGLRMLGAANVSHAVPNRMVHGYGLSPALVEELATRSPDLLVTVDHGIACHAGIAAAKARGIALEPDVIVADDACATRDLDGVGGKTVPHEVLHQASLATLSDTFADVQSTDAILALKWD